MTGDLPETKMIHARATSVITRVDVTETRVRTHLWCPRRHRSIANTREETRSRGTFILC